MARQAKNNVNKFKGLEDSPAIQGIEKIYKANEKARQKRVSEAMEKQQKEQQEKQEEDEQQTDRQTDQTAVEAEPTPQAAASSLSPVSSPSPVPAAAPAAPASELVARKSGKKTQNGITIYVPMEYYMQILQMKMETGVPIKDIALNAVIEYLDRHKND